MKDIKSLAVFITFLLLLFPASAANHVPDGWCIETQSRENYNGVTLANGRIGLVSGAGLFAVSEIVLNGVYDREYAGGVSRLVRAPLYTGLQLKIEGQPVDHAAVSHWKQCLDMRHASLTTSVQSHGVRIEYTLRALRNLPFMSLGEIAITPDKDVDIELVNKVSFPEELRDGKSHFKMMRDAEAYMPVLVAEAESLTGMQQLATCSAFLIEPGTAGEADTRKVKGEEGNASFSKRLKKGETFRCALVGVACSSRDFADPKGEAERMVVFALRQSAAYLIEGHNAHWDDLWKSDIVIEGCPEDQQDVRLALYHLYSFQRKGSRLSIPPMGLSTVKGYNGHVFWDAELWMYPPVLLLNQDLAKAHIDYRSDRLAKAVQRAEMFGYQGAMYPWESDDYGEEATPTWCLTGTFEHHITADIGIAFWNYYRVTRDKEWLREEGYPVIRRVADFWVSRVFRNEDDSYSIKNVVGADEYAPNVDDNAFTNGAAKVALTNAVKAARVLQVQPDERWEKIADGIRFHYMDDGTMMEHSRYQGEMIKQADVNLLAYPLGIITEPEAVKRDLAYYEEKIDKVNGPAMGSAILSVLHARLGDAEEAYRLFKKSYIPNRRPSFGVLSESPASNNPYFATGAGGMLQAVLYGFGGLELTDNGVEQRTPVLPKAWKSLTIKGVGMEKKDIIIH